MIQAKQKPSKLISWTQKLLFLESCLLPMTLYLTFQRGIDQFVGGHDLHQLFTLCGIFAPPVAFLWTRYLGRAAEPIEESDIVRVDSLPKGVRIYTSDGQSRTFGVDHFDLTDLRQQLERSVFPRLLNEALHQLESGKPIAVSHPHSPIVAIWVGLALLLSLVHPGLIVLPAIGLWRELRASYSHQRVWSMDSSGLRLDNNKLLPWDKVSVIFQGQRTVLLADQKPVVLSAVLSQQGWLTTRLVKVYRPVPVVMIDAGGYWGKRWNEHGLYVAGVGSGAGVGWMSVEGKCIAAPEGL